MSFWSIEHGSVSVALPDFRPASYEEWSLYFNNSDWLLHPYGYHRADWPTVFNVQGHNSVWRSLWDGWPYLLSFMVDNIIHRVHCLVSFYSLVCRCWTKEAVHRCRHAVVAGRRRRWRSKSESLIPRAWTTRQVQTSLHYKQYHNMSRKVLEMIGSDSSYGTDWSHECE